MHIRFHDSFRFGKRSGMSEPLMSLNILHPYFARCMTDMTNKC
eukprot:TCALIF_07600-PA protein Name:"Protein of unknown function" AED:0.66 eAED:0.81 QI:0/0/0/1/0/0.5/2/0/42